MEMNLMVKAVQDYVKRCMAPFAARLKSIEDRAAAGEFKGERGEPGIAGKDGTPGERGTDGLNGKDGLPGERGEKGIDGRDGVPGEKGADGISGKDGSPGEKGDRGEPGEQGHPGKDGTDGHPGEKGADGKSVTMDDMAPVLEAVVTRWSLDFERRAQDVLQRAVDKFPIPKDGRDALELEDLSVEHDGDGGVTLKFTRGELVKEFTLRLPRFKVKGGYREGLDYREGDGVGFGSNFYIAQKDAPAGKPGESEDWWLAARKGRDGKDAKAIELPVRDVVRLS